MILVFHQDGRVKAVTTIEGQKIDFNNQVAIVKVLHELAALFPEEKIVWCELSLREMLNLKWLNTILLHKRMLVSFNPDPDNYLGKTMGYIDESLFVKVNKDVSYPTWQMSSTVGMIEASTLIRLESLAPYDEYFDYYLNSIAKLGMPAGLLCYSDPRLLITYQKVKNNRKSLFTVFRFVRQHYKLEWILLLFFNLLVYESRFPIFPFIRSFFYKQRRNGKIDFEDIADRSSGDTMGKVTVDVLIPTIGRGKYLYDVLTDLKRQSLLPSKIIIVEQNPLEGSISELDYLSTESWPFLIEHIFTHKTGACNARNRALEKTVSEWVFLADDDIRIEKDFLAKAFFNISKWNANAYTLRCYQIGEKQTFKNVIQWGGFGSGCSIVKKEALEGCYFNMGFEHGFGEDSDFGMQIRNKGQDVLYLPEPEIVHLKAPVGGFRTVPVLMWHSEVIQPKPSPTIMLYILRNNTREQLRGYKTILFIKYFRHQKIKNPVRYFRMFQKQWNQSVFWANELSNK